jgi:GT2 family glycosyltransferase
MKSLDIFIVIPVYNRLAYTKACLRSLSQQSVQGFNVVVVDDSSSDGTAEVLLEKFPYVTVLSSGGNLWWSGTMNKGVKYVLDSGGKYIISLNNDTEIAPDFIEQMIKSAQEKPEALLGSYTLDIDSKRPNYGGTRMNWGGKNIQLLDILNPEQRKGLHWVTHFPGRGLWIPSVVFKKVGLFDAEAFPQTAADYDFTMRASRAGHKTYCNFDAKLYSHVHASCDWEYRLNFSLKNYIRHLTDIKGGGNLMVFIKFTMRHCPPRYKTQHLIKGVIARLGGYPWRWLKHSLGRGRVYNCIPNM